MLAGRIPELYVAALGTLKNGSVFCPLFSAFGPEPIRARLRIGGARVLVTTAALYRKKVAAICASALPDLEHVLLVGGDGRARPRPGTHDLGALLVGGAEPVFDDRPTDPEDPALLHFTSGTTGKPKGARARARGRGRAPRDRPRSRSTSTRTTSSGAPPIPAG